MTKKINNKPRFIVIPSEILFDKELAPSQRNVFGFLFFLDKEKGCYTTNKNIAEIMEMSEWEVSRAISKLRRLGHIEVTKNEEGHRHITIASQYQDLQKTLHKSTRRGGLQKSARRSASKSMKSQEKNTPLNTSGIKSLSLDSFPNVKESSNFSSREQEEEKLLAASDDAENQFKKSFSKKITSLMDYWNTLPNVPKHKNKDSQVYSFSCQKLDLLIKGQLGEKVSLDEIWSKRHNIPEHWSTEKWTTEQIKSTMKKISNLYTEGYWPQDKSKLPRQLHRLIYSPETMSSWFLMIRKVGVKRLADLPYVGKKSSDKIEPVLLEKELVSAFSQIKEQKLSASEIIGVRRLGWALISLRDALAKRNGNLKHLYGQGWNETYLTQKFIDWIGTSFGDWRNISPRMFMPETNLWTSFIAFIADGAGEPNLLEDETLLTMKGE